MAEAPGSATRASVIVPVYNDPEGVETTLASLVEQTYPREAHEVLVVDNGSTDRTREVVRRFAGAHDHVELLVEDEIQGSYAARNRGIEHADGEVLAFVDADMSVEPDWLERVVGLLEEEGIDCLGCAVEMYPAREEPSLADRFNMETDLQIERYARDMGFVPTCSLVVRRSVLDDVGPFDPGLISSGDREFGHRVVESGRTLHVAPQVVLRHPTRSSVRALVKKSVRIGRGHVQLRRRHPDRYGHPAARVLSPGAYLPVTPWSLRENVDGWDDLSLRERAAFVAVATLQRWAKAYGQLRELFAGRREPAPDVPRDVARAEAIPEAE